ncbi:hypothetical protein J1N35_021488 [Gossypium stocksii]|uniref:Uncharacterized protein n=1 Tax=Gossypium stocksii TaxID=47602 RepID=A0A9D4A1W5_9ROSI|nr:hypothetical protein J1N35_021488 [Gossypium stocksii]
MDAHKAYSERIARGVRNINSQELRETSLHILKKFACRGPQNLACELERYTYPTCLRSTQNVNSINSEVK